VHGHPGEQASEALSVEIRHRETGDKVFGERLGVTARLRSSSSSPVCVLFVRLGDIDPSSWATTMVELPLRFRPSWPPYMFLISYLALVLVPFADLLDVLACLHVVKLTRAYLLLTLVIKLT
jgi:hypothetical protein